MKKTLLYSALVAFLVTGTTLGVFSWFQQGSNRTVKIEHIDGNPAKSIGWTVDKNGEAFNPYSE